MKHKIIFWVFWLVGAVISYPVYKHRNENKQTYLTWTVKELHNITRDTVLGYGTFVRYNDQPDSLVTHIDWDHTDMVQGIGVSCLSWIFLTQMGLGVAWEYGVEKNDWWSEQSKF